MLVTPFRAVKIIIGMWWLFREGDWPLVRIAWRNKRYLKAAIYAFLPWLSLLVEFRIMKAGTYIRLSNKMCQWGQR